MPKRPDPVENHAASQLQVEVGRRLALLLDVVGWDQSQVSRLLGTDQSTVNKWIRGTRLQPVYHMVTICEQSGCTLEFLYRGMLGGRFMREDLALQLAARAPELVAESPQAVPARKEQGLPSTAKAQAV